MKTISELRTLLSGCRIAVIGMGNPDRADDGFGIQVAKRLKAEHPDRIFVEQDGIEKAVEEIRARNDIDFIVFVDTVDAGELQGRIMIAEADELEERILSSHRIPLKLFGTLAKKPFLVVGIQPRNLGFGEPLSHEAEQGIKEVVSNLSKLLK
jgi:hydrogenase 3 maturation protease